MDILGHERGPMWTFLFHGHLRQEMTVLLELASERGADAVVRQRVAAIYIDVEILRLLGCRSLTAHAHGENPGPRSSLEKLFGSELSQRVRGLAADLLGADLLLGDDDPRAPWAGRWARSYLFARADTIMGGTSEVQRTVIARQLLGMPR
jgi:alkylation response protein AidB-like acyl-CoA dehydrogenase